MFAGMARSLALKRTPERCCPQEGSNLIGKHCNRLEKAYKGTNTLVYLTDSVITAVKSFIRLAPGRFGVVVNLAGAAFVSVSGRLLKLKESLRERLRMQNVAVACDHDFQL
jgi:hypothetical protein